MGVVRTISLMLGLAVAEAEAGALIDELEFTRRYVQRVEKTIVGAKVTISGPLTVDIAVPESNELTANLVSAYRDYAGNPENIDEVLQKYVDMLIKLQTQTNIEPQPDRLFPVVRDLAFIQGATRSVDGDVDREAATMPLAGDLGILFAFDLPETMQFAQNADARKIEADQERLLQFAIRNFERHLPEPEVNSVGALTVLSGLGAYGSSLLLSDAFWKEQNFRYRGNLVVFVVSRELLIVTGSEESEALDSAAKLAAEWIVDQPYPITVNPVVRKDGRWQAFGARLN